LYVLVEDIASREAGSILARLWEQAIRPDSRVAYVDYDPVGVTHARALLGSSPGVAVIDADLRRPGLITGSPPLTDLIDFSEPVAILLAAVLHFIRDDDDPYGIAGTLKSAMAPGSYLVISHVTQDGVSREENEGGQLVYQKASAPVVPRRHDEVLRFFDGTELIDPGLVSISQWRSHGHMRQLIYGGIGRKPAPPQDTPVNRQP
jgi:S-adenosyl methyltransferase